ncbi:MAG: hypothetical protein PHE17_20910 [Thiothrix sp.]|uniref:hypothetical protein n=1 Tax=Thiothrix sp. TaxID=1032 RepID=UPI00260E4276|nr:hypothetical protein [Thiothrix sp.]MDD5395492.1 hypothetical protein [Thiothrix sp.]
MPHPLVMVNGSDWTKILKYLKETIVFLALHDGISDEAVEILIGNYVKAIEGSKDDIFIQTAIGITQYLNFYNVIPAQGIGDEFKGIYFTGIAVSEHLNNLGYADLNKLHLRAVLRLLDFRLEEPHKISRKALTDRIRSVIDNNAVNEHLGKYGWYLIYKCLYNSVNNKTKTI